MFQRTCSSCGGSGTKIASKCTACSGSGTTPEKKAVSVEIPAGVQHGMAFTVKGQGHVGGLGGRAGDIYLLVEVEPSRIFQRDGSDVYVEVPISLAHAALGGVARVPTLDGTIDLRVQPGTQPGEKLVLRGKGIKNINSSSHGNQYVTFKVEIPRYGFIPRSV